MLTREQLAELSKVDIATVGKSNLVDIQSVTIDPTLPVEERLSRFVAQVTNPYLFMCGETPVRVTFRQNGHTLEHLLQAHFSTRRER